MPVHLKRSRYPRNRCAPAVHRLGWLIDRDRRYVEVYRLGRSVEALIDPAQLSGEEVLPGFALDMSLVW